LLYPFVLQFILWFIVTSKVCHDFSSTIVSFHNVYNFWFSLTDGSRMIS
jgi:hypothetical protein